REEHLGVFGRRRRAPRRHRPTLGRGGSLPFQRGHYNRAKRVPTLAAPRLAGATGPARAVFGESPFAAGACRRAASGGTRPRLPPPQTNPPPARMIRNASRAARAPSQLGWVLSRGASSPRL